ncbi:MAG: 30S ribosomal protein S8 [uncultured bacterium]|nr:MAG: 30S ribosomal protein S8 [uncultured bacterium]OGT16844.1 MAG: 30S ribosomal protein S8 [Gammaproteobacteria bacterium RIFCSPHIGHO2_02_FULL_38_33]OGT23910.1 MAG: 30S ribosomal protein S8 [Gammaproteobacteria bacterium RIFCSPHIGHO2_12_38_15]OGT67122.1 MAG: 30S ribosomal protein S8 [Gammaproteobacteria bacterium RIFCSPLOWO2_02_FULL_38_11]OGT76117.1 MAG: 30S ribosomal protein S8 [Gammaproteobacteria bacterium RIFCSPLOWO2_12_FULL_38_14]
MSMQDPISDMLCQIRNAQKAEKKEVAMTSSKMKIAIANILKQEGYILDYKIEKEGVAHALLILFLKYYQGKPVIEKIKRFSRCGLRRYSTKKDLPRVLGGLGIAIVSTSKGIMTDQAARLAGVGGEVLCYVF